jgi:hypothetical protein
VFSDPQLNSIEKIVLLALADAANDEGTCYPSYKTLLLKTGLKKRNTLATTLAKLETDGYLKRHARGSIGTGKQSTRYDLTPTPIDRKVTEGYLSPKSNRRLPPISNRRLPEPKSTAVLTTSRSSTGAPKAARRSRLTLDALPPDWETAASTLRPDLHLPTVWTDFHGYHAAKGSTMLDWRQAWLNWVRKEKTHATYRQTTADRIQQANRIHEAALAAAKRDLGGGPV